jgi:hypothetical protein
MHNVEGMLRSEEWTGIHSLANQRGATAAVGHEFISAKQASIASNVCILHRASCIVPNSVSC